MSIRALPKWQNDASGATCGRFHSAITQTHPNNVRVSGALHDARREGAALILLRGVLNCRGTGVPSHTIPGSFYSAQTGTYIFNALHGLAVQALSKSAHFHSSGLLFASSDGSTKPRMGLNERQDTFAEATKAKTHV